MKNIIPQQKSFIPACDITIEEYETLLEKTADLPQIGAYKIGFQLALLHGLPQIVDLTRKYTPKPVIFDPQKGATDIPDLGKSFAQVCSHSGIDAIILFPMSGPNVEEAWIKAAQEEGLGVIVGGKMTHKGYLQSEGGYIADSAIPKMYLNAARLGVRDFVVPGNLPDFVSEVINMLSNEVENPVYYAPGFIAQGGKIEETAKVIGDNWHAIIGRAITGSSDIKKSIEELSSKL